MCHFANGFTTIFWLKLFDNSSMTVLSVNLVHRITGMLELREIQKNCQDGCSSLWDECMHFGSIVSLKMHMVAYSNLMRIK